MLNLIKLEKSPSEWTKIHQGMKRYRWDDFTLERRGEMTVWLSQKHHERYSEWNKLAEKFRPIVETHILHLSKEQEIDSDLASYLSWDLINLVIEDTFSDIKNLPCFYKNEILPLYKENKVAYGWAGEFPTGSLVYG